MTRTIVAADDHPLFRQALAMAVGAVAPDARVLEAGTLDAAHGAVRSAVGDGTLALILLDLRMPGAEGFAGIALLHAEAPDVPILVVSSADAAQAAAESRRFGAVGFIGKDADLSVIEGAIADALAGRAVMPDDAAANADAADVDAMAARVASLTPMQLRVLLGVLDGRLNKQIAHDLSITEATVKAHMTAILKKLDVGNRTQAALAARALGLGITHR